MVDWHLINASRVTMLHTLPLQSIEFLGLKMDTTNLEAGDIANMYLHIYC